MRAEDESRLAQLRKVRPNGSCASGMAITTRCTAVQEQVWWCTHGIVHRSGKPFANIREGYGFQ
jgi:hypothetical protein